MRITPTEGCPPSCSSPFFCKQSKCVLTLPSPLLGRAPWLKACAGSLWYTLRQAWSAILLWRDRSESVKHTLQRSPSERGRVRRCPLSLATDGCTSDEDRSTRVRGEWQWKKGALPLLNGKKVHSSSMAESIGVLLKVLAYYSLHKCSILLNSPDFLTYGFLWSFP